MYEFVKLKTTGECSVIRFLNILLGIIVTVFGLFLWINTDATIQFFSIYFGLFFAAVAVLGYFVTKKLGVEHVLRGQLAISGIIGLTFLFLPMISYAILTWIFIFVFFMFALFNVVRVVTKKQNGVIRYIIQAILATVFIIYAITMLFNPRFGGQTLAKLIAFFVIMNGISYFFPPSTWSSMEEME